jgi:hypothetical protein
MAEGFNRIALKDLVAQQLPEFVRAEYPTFVSFVEAYYEFLDQQDVDLASLRDIDRTLDDYIKYFKEEIAHNYPIVSSNYDTERFLLKHIKEQYLAKGSEASYKLLFRLLYGKDVFIDYPGKQMLRVSDGRWTQDVSIFVNVLTGDPYALIGKTVTIQTSKRIFNLNVVKNVDAANKITATVENVLPVSGAPGIYELFINRNFYGDITASDSVKYGSEFQGQILPSTAKIKITNAGKGFKPGQVFQISSGEGTPFWFKVSSVYEDGGLKTIDVIRFGLKYTTDFSATVAPSSAVSSKKKVTQSVPTLTYNISSGIIRSISVTEGGAGYTSAPTVTINGTGTGATAHAIINGSGQVTSVVLDTGGSNYNVLTTGITFTNAVGDVTGGGAHAEALVGADYDYGFIDNSAGFTEGGYLNAGDYWDVLESGSGARATATISGGHVTHITITNGGSGYTVPSPTIDICAPLDANGIPISGGVTAKATLTVTNGVITGATITNQGSGYISTPKVDIHGAYGYSDGAYVGTVSRQFFINAADTQGKNPALLNVSLGAVSKYPGYYKTNDGFLSDSMFVQDSYYYQAFAYVLKIDEQLQSYASVVRTMLHPSGMSMFGEYSINNNINLSIGLDALIKSLGITLYDQFVLDDSYTTWWFTKDLSDNPHVIDLADAFKLTINIWKNLEDSFGLSDPSNQITRRTTKVFDGTTQQALTTEYLTQLFTKVVPVNDSIAYLRQVDEDVKLATTKVIPLSEGYATPTDLTNGIQYPTLSVSLNMDISYLNTSTFGNTGYIVMEPYEQGGYFAEIYANGRASTW